MKKLSAILFLVLFCSFTCSADSVAQDGSVSFDDLTEQDGVYFKKSSDVPFTGKVTGRVTGYLRDGRAEGLWKIHGNDGGLEETGRYENGRKEGLWEFYRSDGQLWCEEQYKNGMRYSLKYYSYQNGQLWAEQYYRDGEADGLWKYYHENGQLDRKAPHKNGKEEGLWEGWYEGGQLRKKGYYKNGKLDGWWRVWYEDGQLKEKKRYENGRSAGLWQSWHEDGRLKTQGRYKNGKRDGLWESWYEDGQPKESTRHKNGIPDGSWKMWREDGELEMDRLFKDGRLLYDMHDMPPDNSFGVLSLRLGDSVKKSKRGGEVRISYCPDNTCKRFSADADNEEQLFDFALLYLFHIPGYAYLGMDMDGTGIFFDLVRTDILALHEKYDISCSGDYYENIALLMMDMSSRYGIVYEYTRYDEGQENTSVFDLSQELLPEKINRNISCDR